MFTFEELVNLGVGLGDFGLKLGNLFFELSFLRIIFSLLFIQLFYLSFMILNWLCPNCLYFPRHIIQMIVISILFLKLIDYVSDAKLNQIPPTLIVTLGIKLFFIFPTISQIDPQIILHSLHILPHSLNSLGKLIFPLIPLPLSIHVWLSFDR